VLQNYHYYVIPIRIVLKIRFYCVLQSHTLRISYAKTQKSMLLCVIYKGNCLHVTFTLIINHRECLLRSNNSFSLHPLWSLIHHINHFYAVSALITSHYASLPGCSTFFVASTRLICNI
jgi:hypothetical protein